MVKLFGGTVTLSTRRRNTYEAVRDDGIRDIYVSHLKTFKYVSIIIWICGWFLTFTQWLGDPITCFSDNKMMSVSVLTSYCHIQSGPYQW